MDNLKDHIKSYWTKRAPSFVEQRLREFESGKRGLWLKEIARYLHLLLGSGQPSALPAVECRIQAFEQAHDIRFSENQRRAVSEAVSRGLLVITGGPGTGKTTIINCILSLLGSDRAHGPRRQAHERGHRP